MRRLLTISMLFISIAVQAQFYAPEVRQSSTTKVVTSGGTTTLGGSAVSIFRNHSICGAALVFKSPSSSKTWSVKNAEDNCGTSGGLHFISSNKTTRLSILQNGNVGIGTTSANAKLTVAGGISGTSLSSGTLSLSKPDASSSSTMLFIGDVGDSDNTRMLSFSEGSSAGIWFQSGFSPSGGENYIQLRSNEGNAMTWKLNGNVGIGTTSPTSKLTVVGNIAGTSVKADMLSVRRWNDGEALIKFNTQRPWEFRTQDVGPSNSLALVSTSNGKSFYIKNSAVNTAEFFTATTPSANYVSLVPEGGKVGIGITNRDEMKNLSAKLTVAGGIHAQEVKVTTNAGADFVFEEDYALRPLSELDKFVKENKHLPEIAPAAQMVEEGVDMGEFQIQLLQKVEELTLYVIGLQKEVEELKGENKELRDTMSKN